MPNRNDGADGRPRRNKARTDAVADADLWRRAVSDVQPLKRPPPPAKPTPAAALPPSRQNPTPAPRPSQSLSPSPKSRPVALPPPELQPGAAGGLDKRTLQRLRRGLIPPEAKIDLHNMTQAEAHAALLRFLAASQAAGRRCVLVITGKGYGPDGAVGVLKTGVPRWLNEPDTRARILAFTHATTAHGGEGALYVLLRRRKPPRP